MEFANLRPLGVGEVLDAAFRVYRTRFRDLIIATAVVVVPLQLLQILITISIPSQDRIEVRNGQLVRVTGPSTAVVLGAFAAIAVLTIVATALAQGSTVRIVADGYLGGRTRWQSSLVFAANNVFRIVGTSILTAICVLLGLIACLLPGVYLYVAFAVAIPALLVERTGVARALGRSRELVSGRWWPTFAALVVVFLLTAILTGLVGALFGAGIVATGTATTSTGTQVLQGLFNAAVTTLVTPLGAAVAVIIYFDLRIRKEGFDVALMAQRLGAAPPPATPPGPGPWAPPPGGAPTPPAGPPPAAPPWHRPAPGPPPPGTGSPPTQPPPGTGAPPPPPPSRWPPPTVPGSPPGPAPRPEPGAGDGPDEPTPGS